MEIMLYACEGLDWAKDLEDPPSFETEDAEREFWAEHDSTEYIDWGKASYAIFPSLKPTAHNIRVVVNL